MSVTGLRRMIFLISTNFYFYYRPFPQQLEQSFGRNGEVLTNRSLGPPQTSPWSPLVCTPLPWGEMDTAQPTAQTRKLSGLPLLG